MGGIFTNNISIAGAQLVCGRQQTGVMFEQSIDLGAGPAANARPRFEVPRSPIER
jgi:hypothetical protein